MKKSFLYLFTMLCAFSFLTACDDDDDQGAFDVNASYTGETLDLKYSDTPLLGKTVTFETKDGKTATITLEGTFDMNIITGLFNGTKSTQVLSLAPGVIPGEVRTTLSNVPLSTSLVASVETYDFEGTDSSNGREIKYKGSVKKGRLEMSLDVTMPGNELSGSTWSLAAQPLNLVWNAGDATIDLTALGYGVQPVAAIGPLVNTMVGPMLHGVLESITYRADGNIVASYKKKGASEWTTSPLNLAQYYISGNKLYVQLNISQIMATVQANKVKANAGDIGHMAEIIQLITPLLPYLSTGFPLSYSVSDGTAQVTLGADVLGKVLPLLTDETIAGMLVKALPEEIQPAVPAILSQLPAIFAKTEDINATLKLVKK